MKSLPEWMRVLEGAREKKGGERGGGGGRDGGRERGGGAKSQAKPAYNTAFNHQQHCLYLSVKVVVKTHAAHKREWSPAQSGGVPAAFTRTEKEEGAKE